jgi:uncharacterized protein (TIRG00374 family)
MPDTVRWTRVVHVAALAVGVALAIVLVAQLGEAGLAIIVGAARWFAAIAVIDVASAACDALAIHAFVRQREPVRYRDVLTAQLGGIAINRLTPGNSLGEPVKVSMLSRHVSGKRAIAAIVLFNLTTMYVSIAAFAIGVPLTAILLDLPASVMFAAWGALAVLGALAALAAWLVRRGAVASLIDLLVGARIISKARGERWATAIADIDQHVRELGGDTSSVGLRVGLVSLIGSRLLNYAGTIALLHASRISVDGSQLIALLTVGVIVTWIASIVPLGLGLSDGSYYVVYQLLGIPPRGALIFSMMLRVRTVVLAVIGLAVMAFANARSRRTR